MEGTRLQESPRRGAPVRRPRRALAMETPNSLPLQLWCLWRNRVSGGRRRRRVRHVESRRFRR